MAKRPTSRTALPNPGWDAFVESQKRIGTKLMDPSNQLLGTVAIVGGVLSSLALARLYTKLSKEPIESPMQVIAGRGLTAMALGVGYVWWELNKAQYENPMMVAATEASDLDWNLDDFGLDEGDVVV